MKVIVIVPAAPAAIVAGKLVTVNSPLEGVAVSPEVYGELLRSHDDGVAEFLDLARVKPNTLGNTRMLLHL